MKNRIVLIRPGDVQDIATMLASVALACAAQYVWERPVVNLMAAMTPVLVHLAQVALQRFKGEEDDEEALEEEQNLRYAIIVLGAAYVSAFLVLAQPREYSWISILLIGIPVSYITFRLIDRKIKRKNQSYERNLLDEPFKLDEAAMEEFVERGARESFYASLIESQANRR